MKWGEHKTSTVEFFMNRSALMTTQMRPHTRAARVIYITKNTCIYLERSTRSIRLYCWRLIQRKDKNKTNNTAVSWKRANDEVPNTVKKTRWNSVVIGLLRGQRREKKIKYFSRTPSCITEKKMTWHCVRWAERFRQRAHRHRVNGERNAPVRVDKRNDDDDDARSLMIGRNGFCYAFAQRGEIMNKKKKTYA